MDQQKEFESLIQRDRDSREDQAWHGTLLGYLEKVKENPSIAKLAHGIPPLCDSDKRDRGLPRYGHRASFQIPYAGGAESNEGAPHS